jgi:hypothetical protein
MTEEALPNLVRMHLGNKDREPGAKRPGREPEKDLTESPGEPESPDVYFYIY